MEIPRRPPPNEPRRRANRHSSSPAATDEQRWDLDFMAYLQHRFRELGTDRLLDALDALEQDALPERTNGARGRSGTRKGGAGS